MPRSPMDRARDSESRYMSSILIGASILLLSCGPTQPRDPVYLTQFEFQAHYFEFERRLNQWFCDSRNNIPRRQCIAAPNVPVADVEYGNFRWIERGSIEEWGGTCTCSHTTDGSTVTIPSDAWHSGCVPHEIAHGVLKRIGHPCWHEFEHQPTAPSDCKIERQSWL